MNNIWAHLPFAHDYKEIGTRFSPSGKFTIWYGKQRKELFRVDFRDATYEVLECKCGKRIECEVDENFRLYEFPRK